MRDVAEEICLSGGIFRFLLTATIRLTWSIVCVSSLPSNGLSYQKACCIYDGRIPELGVGRNSDVFGFGLNTVRERSRKEVSGQFTIPPPCPLNLRLDKLYDLLSFIAD